MKHYKILALKYRPQTFKDLTFSDLYYSKIRKGSNSDTASKQVIIVNIKDGNKTETRERIVKFLSKINNSNNKPKVIGLDVIFDTYSNRGEIFSLSIRLVYRVSRNYGMTAT